MKIIKNYILLMLSAITLVVTSCQKGNIDKTPGTTTMPDKGGDYSDGKKLTRIDIDENNSATFTYRADGLLASYHHVFEGDAANIAITYNADKKPVTAILDDATYKLSYNGNHFYKAEIYKNNKPTELSYYYQYTYTGDYITQVGLFAQIGEAGFRETSRMVYEYNTAGDITTASGYYLDVLTNALEPNTTITYNYDTKLNPLNKVADLMTILLAPQSVHNIAKAVSRDKTGAIRTTDKFTFVYNSSNYPVSSKKIRSTQGASDVITTTVFGYQ